MNLSMTAASLLGLSSIEKTILFTLESPKGLQNIAADSKILRTSVSYNLKNLVKRGLVQQEQVGKRFIYRAISPAELSKNLQKIIDRLQLENLERKGVRVKTSKEDEFIIHVGPKEIIPAFTRIATEVKGDRVKAIQHHESFNELLRVTTKKQLIEFNQAVIRNKIIIDGILNEGAYNSYYKEIISDPKNHLEQVKSLEGRMSDYSVFPDNRFEMSSEIWIFKKTSMIINWYEEIAIEITNKRTTDLLREMFEYVKHGSKKIDHNAYMRQLIEKVNLHKK